MRRGLTLAELVVVLAILAIVTAITLPRLAGVRDWIAVDTAAQEVIGAIAVARSAAVMRSEEHTSELQSQSNLVCRLLLEKKNRVMSLMTLSKHIEFKIQSYALGLDVLHSRAFDVQRVRPTGSQV